MTTGYDQANRPAYLQGTRAGTSTNYVGNPNDSSKWAQYTPSGNPYYFIRGNGVWHVTGYNSRLQPTEIYDAFNNDAGQTYFVSCLNWGDGPNGSSPAYTKPNNVYKFCPDMTASVNNGNLRGSSELHGGPGNQQFLRFDQTYSYDVLNR